MCITIANFLWIQVGYETNVCLLKHKVKTKGFDSANSQNRQRDWGIGPLARASHVRATRKFTATSNSLSFPVWWGGGGDSNKATTSS